MDELRWNHLLRKKLIHPDAILCVAVDTAIEAWRTAGFTPTRIACELNARYAGGYLERKAAYPRFAEVGAASSDTAQDEP